MSAQFGGGGDRQLAGETAANVGGCLPADQRAIIEQRWTTLRLGRGECGNQARAESLPEFIAQAVQRGVARRSDQDDLCNRAFHEVERLQPLAKRSRVAHYRVLQGAKRCFRQAAPFGTAVVFRQLEQGQGGQ